MQNPQGTAAAWDNGTFTIESIKGNHDLTNGTSYTYQNLFPGSYTFTESANGNYDLVAINGADSAPGRSGIVELASDEDENIEFVNRQKTVTVTIVKDVRDPLGADVSDSTSFTARVGSASTSFAEGSNGSFVLNPGVYTFTEDAKIGYVLNSINPDNDADASNGTTQTLSSNVPLTVTFTNYQNYGSISGHKYEDADGDLATTGDRSPVVNWLIQLFRTDSNYENGVEVGTVPTYTDVNGFYSFTNLIPGYYRVVEEVKAGWQALSSLFVNLFVDPGEANPNQDFVNFEKATITVTKDILNPDGSAVADPTGGFTVTLNAASQQPIAEGVIATYSNLGPGTYTIVENTIPSNFTFDSYSIDEDTNTPGAQITVESGETENLVVSNRQKTATITVVKDVQGPKWRKRNQ